MSPDLERRLREKHPAIFRKVRRTGRGPAPIEARGIECGDGWCDLLDSLFELIMQPYSSPKVYDNTSDPAKTSASLERKRKRIPAILQIKEKFGLLRIYMYRGNRQMRELISFAEHHSGKVFEACGAPGSLRTDGWMRVQCEACTISENNGNISALPED